MKRSEILNTYRDSIEEAMVTAYHNVLKCYGRIQYKIYVWEDGEIESLEGVQGDNCCLVAKDSEPRDLEYVCTIDSPCFDPWDYDDESAPDDEDECERMEGAIIDYLVSEYKREGVRDALDAVIDEAESEEEYYEEYYDDEEEEEED